MRLLGVVTGDELLEGQFADTNHTVDADNPKTALPPAVNCGAADVQQFGDLAERVELLRRSQSRFIEVSQDSIIVSRAV